MRKFKGSGLFGNSHMAAIAVRFGHWTTIIDLFIASHQNHGNHDQRINSPYKRCEYWNEMWKCCCQKCAHWIPKVRIFKLVLHWNTLLEQIRFSFSNQQNIIVPHTVIVIFSFNCHVTWLGSAHQPWQPTDKQEHHFRFPLVTQ